MQGVDIGNEFLTLSNGTGDFRSSGTASWAGPITLTGDVDINVFGGTFTNSGVISGSGGFTKLNTGKLVLTGSSANTYSGSTFVNQGIVELAKPGTVAIPGPLTIGDGLGGVNADIVRELNSFQIGNVPVTINASGLLDLNGFTDTIGALVFNGGNADAGTGLLALGGNVTANLSTNVISGVTGNLSLGGVLRTFDVANGQWLTVNGIISGSGGIFKNGLGLLDLYGTNTYSGLTTINAGTLVIRESLGLGTTAAGTVLAGGELYILTPSPIGEPLTNTSAASILFANSFSTSLTSNLVLNANLTASIFTTTLDLTGVISGIGGITKIGTGTLRYSGALANTYLGTTTVNAGTLELAKIVANSALVNGLVIGDGIGGVNADVVRLQTTSQLANTTTAVTVNSSGLFDLNNISEIAGSLAGSGNVTLGTADIVINVGSDNSSTVFSGVISEPGGLTKSGSGTMTLSGNNTYTSQTVITGGKLLVNGSQP